MIDLPSPPTSPSLPHCSREAEANTGHWMLAGAQVLGAGAEGPRGLVQVPAGELETGTGDGWRGGEGQVLCPAWQPIIYPSHLYPK